MHRISLRQEGAKEDFLEGGILLSCRRWCRTGVHCGLYCSAQNDLSLENRGEGIPGGRRTSSSGGCIVVLEVSLIGEFVGNAGECECVTSEPRSPLSQFVVNESKSFIAIVAPPSCEYPRDVGTNNICNLTTSKISFFS